MRICALVLIVAAASCLSRSTPTPATRNSAFENVAWLEGLWRGEREDAGTVFEERWSAPVGGAMIGSFRLVKAGQPQFYEIILIEQSGADLLMRIRHFGPGLSPWEKGEETPTFRVRTATANRIELDQTAPPEGQRLVYERDGDRLTVKLFHPSKPDDAHVFRFERIR